MVLQGPHEGGFRIVTRSPERPISVPSEAFGGPLTNDLGHSNDHVGESR